MPNDTQTQQHQPTAQVPARAPLPAVVDSGEFSMLMDSSKFAQLQRIGTMYARSKMVPTHFQGDEPSCMVAVQMAMRLNIDPFMFLQKTYVVSGKPGMEAPLIIALVNTRGPFKGPINWDVKRNEVGDVTECTAYATHRDTGQVCSSTITWKMVEAEGWSKKQGSKWLTLREQMFKYRSATFLARLYCPEVIMGMSANDELEEIEINPQPTTDIPPPARAGGLKDKLASAGHVVDVEASEGLATVPRETGTQKRARDSANEGKSTTSANEKGARKLATAPPADASVEQLVDAGQIVIHDDPPAGTTAAQEGAGEPQGHKPAEEARPPALPYENALALAKKAKTPDQVDIVRDGMRGSGYTEEQRLAIDAILNSKKFME